MDEEIRINIELSPPTDDDGFIRRECPACDRQFKWFASNTDDDAEPADQYFCPMCGVQADVDDWNTQDQIDGAIAQAEPHITDELQSHLKKTLRKAGFDDFKPDPSFHLDLGGPGQAMHEPNDMVIVAPPCHPNEPVKVQDAAAAGELHCLICGARFAA